MVSQRRYRRGQHSSLPWSSFWQAGHRSIEIHGTLKKVTRRTGIRFVSATMPITEGATGRLLEGNIAVINEFYSELIGEKVRIKRQQRAECGEWNGGRRPYGYASTNGRLIVVDEEAANLRQIFDLFLEHPSAVAVCGRLRALGIKDRRGRPWSSSSIEAILRNPVYKGEVRLPSGGTQKGIHTALVSVETWEHVRTTTPTRQRLVTKIDRPFPLAGLLFCGACNATMCLHYVSKKNGRKIARYRCTTTFNRGWRECPVKEVNADQIERWVKEQLAHFGADGAVLEAAMAAANVADAERAGPLRQEQALLLERINEVRTKIDRLVDAISEGGAGFQSIRAKLTLEERNLRLLEQDLGRVKTEIHRIAGEPLDPDKLRHVLQDFDTLFTVASAAERKELLQLLIKRLVFRGHDAEVTLELYSTVNLTASGSIFRAPWLRRRASNYHGTHLMTSPCCVLNNLCPAW